METQVATLVYVQLVLLVALTQETCLAMQLAEVALFKEHLESSLITEVVY